MGTGWHLVRVEPHTWDAWRRQKPAPHRVLFCRGLYPLVDVELPSSDDHPLATALKECCKETGTSRRVHMRRSSSLAEQSYRSASGSHISQAALQDDPKKGLRRAQEEALLDGHIVKCIAPWAPYWKGLPPSVYHVVSLREPVWCHLWPLRNLLASSEEVPAFG